MKQKIKTTGKRGKPVGVFFIIGFLLGVLIPNIMWKDIYMQAGIVSMYLLECVADLENERQSLLYDVIQKRAGSAVMTALLGISIFGVPVSVCMIALLAFEFGSILTSSILQFGIQGGLIGTALLFPHGLFYCAGMFGICVSAFYESVEIWKNRSVFNKRLYKYLGKIFLFILLIGIGIILEVYVSPVLTKNIINNFKIFS